MRVRRTGGQAAFDERREMLIEAAGQVFAERGLQEATVRKICSRAGTNGAAVNCHFGDKLSLYTEVLRSSIFELKAAEDASIAHLSDASAAFKMLIYEWFERMREGGRPAWFACIIAHEMAQPTPALDLVTQAMRANYLWFRTLL